MNSSNESIVFLNSNSEEESNLLAIGVQEEIVFSAGEDAFDVLESFLRKNQKWVFGYLGYDLKNQVEDLLSENHDGLGFPDICFFVPKAVYSLETDSWDLLASYDTEFTDAIEDPRSFLKPERGASNSAVKFNSRTPHSRYISQVESLLNHIQRGDIYEANYCVEFYQGQVDLAPLATYWNVNEQTEAPYSAYFKHQNIHAISGSPELFLEKRGYKITSKPIKGTRKRGASQQEDEELKSELVADQKERSENVMIVDLVRNDLSKTAIKNSVKVDELYGIHTFKTVHHMISTVSSEVAADTSSVEVLRTTFPMGSMTGAPKVSAMKLIEAHEDMKRGLYSGAIGFFAPDGDFTFNVVIRTLLYNSNNKYLSLMAGGAITAGSDPESEYRESLLKASALKKAIYEID